MRDVLARQRAFRCSADGATAIEYSLIAALIVIVIITTLSLVRTNLLALPFPALIAAFGDALS
ncbi:MAG: Flp family type IVb pilin [Geminicoccaceae bacterium]